MRRMILACLAAVAACVSGGAVQAANLVLNGDFEITSLPGSNAFGTFNPNNVVLGWDTTGFNFIFAPGTADTTGSAVESGATLSLWGPGNGSNNGLTISPTGGNFIGADGDYEAHPIEQVISGLTIGKKYELSFYWAAAQQHTFDGTTTESWEVSLGNETFFTPVANNADHGFVPWTQEKFIFTAQNTSDTLSFLAHGTPAGQPPFSLLDGVRLSEAVPEPATWAMMLLGFGFVGAAMRGRSAGNLFARLDRRLA